MEEGISIPFDVFNCSSYEWSESLIPELQHRESYFQQLQPKAIVATLQWHIYRYTFYPAVASSVGKLNVLPDTASLVAINKYQTNIN